MLERAPKGESRTQTRKASTLFLLVYKLANCGPGIESKPVSLRTIQVIEQVCLIETLGRGNAIGHRVALDVFAGYETLRRVVSVAVTGIPYASRYQHGEQMNGRGEIRAGRVFRQVQDGPRGQKAGNSLALALRAPSE